MNDDHRSTAAGTTTAQRTRPAEPKKIARSSTALMVLGCAVLAVGVFGLLRAFRADDASSADGRGAMTPVLAFVQDLDEGASGDELISHDLVALVDIPVADLPSDAIVDVEQLSGTELITAVRAGTPVSSSVMVTPPANAAARVQLEPGYEAVALTLPFDPAVGGYVRPGDRINIYAVLSQTVGAQPDHGDAAGAAEEQGLYHPTDGGPVVETLLHDVTVLDTSADLDPRIATGEPVRPSMGSITYLLALQPRDAARVIFMQVNHDLYITLRGPESSSEPVHLSTANVRSTDGPGA